MAFSDWASYSAQDEPWLSFTRAKAASDSGNRQEAIGILREITARPSLESRHYLQAWHFLRQFGEQPSPEISKNVLGVVIEVFMPGGLDLLAAYHDHCARYYNFSGAGVVWERPNDSLDSAIDEILGEAGNLVMLIGPWDKPRPPAPPVGHGRINILTPSGLHFGQGPLNAMARDQRGGKIFALCTALMQQLMQLHKSAGTT